MSRVDNSSSCNLKKNGTEFTSLVVMFGQHFFDMMDSLGALYILVTFFSKKVRHDV